jgi:hypothetical protein
MLSIDLVSKGFEPMMESVSCCAKTEVQQKKVIIQKNRHFSFKKWQLAVGKHNVKKQK